MEVPMSIYDQDVLAMAQAKFPGTPTEQLLALSDQQMNDLMGSPYPQDIKVEKTEHSFKMLRP